MIADLSDLALVLAGLTLLAVSLLCADVVGGVARLPHIEKQTPLPGGAGPALPKISIIVAARNEERSLEGALRSLLQLSYPQLEIIVANDRSTDRTEEILNELGQQYPSLRAIHIRELPPAWLGKNHALQKAAGIASGDYLLFTDADVVFERDILQKIAAYVQQNAVDHLALLVKVDSSHFLTRELIGFFGFNFLGFFRPWKARDPKSRCFIGIGAFNMVRKSIYGAIGGHSKIALRPDDDVKLGKLVKLAGFRQHCALCVQAIRVEWYASIREFVIGLEKNIFSGLDYRLGLAAFGVVALNVFFVAPLFVALFATGAVAKICGLIWLLSTLANCWVAWVMGSRFLSGLGFPVAAFFLSLVMIRNTAKNLRDGGIYWRDTFYSLDELRANKL